MADLSSCYFCGATMDVSLREHPVVPAAFSPTPDRQTTVVLCGTCERKLERVLDPVVDAAAPQRRAAAKDAAGGDSATHGDATTAENAASTGDNSATANAGDDATPNVPSGTLSGVRDDETEDASDADGGNAARSDDASDAADDGTPFDVDDTTSVFDEDVDETASDSVFANETDVPTTTIPDAEADRDGSDGIAFDDQSSDRTPDGTGNATNQRRERTNATGSDATGESSADTTPSDGADDSSGTDEPDVDPRTYNKVVRLLKNRDLPVARAEIESIAGSAYDIPDHECEAIVDAAVQRGLVAEDGTELTYPDGV